MAMEGHIDALGAPFHRRGIALFLSAPGDEEWAARIGQLEDVKHVCGAALIEAGVIPRTYELDGAVVEDQPVRIRLGLSAEAFNAIQQQAYEAERRGHLLRITVTLSGKSLPDPDSFGGILLTDLDLSERREFAVTAVSFTETDECLCLGPTGGSQHSGGE